MASYFAAAPKHPWDFCAAKGEVITRIFSKEIEKHANYQPRAKLYKKEVMFALKKNWPELYSSEIARFSQRDRNDWAALPGKDYSPTKFNELLGIAPRFFGNSIKNGCQTDNPAQFVGKACLRSIRSSHEK